VEVLEGLITSLLHLLGKGQWVLDGSSSMRKVGHGKQRLTTCYWADRSSALECNGEGHVAPTAPCTLQLTLAST